VRVRFSGRDRTVTDGPFAETKELVAGFWLWQVRSMEEAVEWAKRCPNPMPGEDSDIEIRQVFEMEDFGDALTPNCANRSAARAQARSSAEPRRHHDPRGPRMQLDSRRRWLALVVLCLGVLHDRARHHGGERGAAVDPR
jgi:hypothetical protein